MQKKIGKHMTEQTHSLCHEKILNAEVHQQVAIRVKITEIHTFALKCKEKWSVPEGFPQELSYSWV